MRILGFSKRWNKLEHPKFTTFRFPRKDSTKGRDWHESEQVQVVYHPRHKNREILGIAKITSKEPRYLARITNQEAKTDGFVNYLDMMRWLSSTYPDRELLTRQPMNKLTLTWIKRL